MAPRLGLTLTRVSDPRSNREKGRIPMAEESPKPEQPEQPEQPKEPKEPELLTEEDLNKVAGGMGQKPVMSGKTPVDIKR
jgi:hypothetical protein